MTDQNPPAQLPDDQGDDQVDQVDPQELPDPGLWKWYNEAPSADTIVERLASLPPQFGGIRVIDYVDYVLPMPQNERIKVHQQVNPRKTVELDRTVPTWTLYMLVAGRVMMKEEAADRNNWRIDLVPDPSCTPDGYVDLGVESGRIVYRMRMEVLCAEGVDLDPPLPSDTDDDRFPFPVVVFELPPAGLQVFPYRVTGWRSRGMRYGQAWVPYEGGTQAKKSNPFEKVETAAAGRVLGMWGIGILPGSGIASVEEMQNIRTAMLGGQDQAQQQQQAAVPKDGNALLRELLAVIEELRQVKPVSDHVFNEGLARYMVGRLGLQDAVDPVSLEVTWSKVPNGQRTLMLRHFRTVLQDSKIDAGMGTQEGER